MSHSVLVHQCSASGVHLRVLIIRRGGCIVQHMRAVVVHRQQLDAPPGVVMPQENGLVVDELATLRIDDFPAEVLVL